MTIALLLLLLARCTPAAIKIATLIRAARAEGRPVDRRALAICLAKLAGRIALHIDIDLPLDE